MGYNLLKQAPASSVGSKVCRPCGERAVYLAEMALNMSYLLCLSSQSPHPCRQIHIPLVLMSVFCPVQIYGASQSEVTKLALYRDILSDPTGRVGICRRFQEFSGAHRKDRWTLYTCACSDAKTAGTRQYDGLCAARCRSPS